MTYTDLINRFWRLDAELQFSTAETRMYLQLLDTFSRVGLNRPITMSNTLATGIFGISLSAYKRVRQSLIDRGLITMELNTVKRRRSAVFRLTDATAPIATKPKSEPKPQQEPVPVPTPVSEPESSPETVVTTNTEPKPVWHNTTGCQHRHAPTTIRIIPTSKH